MIMPNCIFRNKFLVLCLKLIAKYGKWRQIRLLHFAYNYNAALFSKEKKKKKKKNYQKLRSWEVLCLYRIFSIFLLSDFAQFADVFLGY